MPTDRHERNACSIIGTAHSLAGCAAVGVRCGFPRAFPLLVLRTALRHGTGKFLDVLWWHSLGQVPSRLAIVCARTRARFSVPTRGQRELVRGSVRPRQVCLGGGFIASPVVSICTFEPQKNSLFVERVCEDMDSIGNRVLGPTRPSPKFRVSWTTKRRKYAHAHCSEIKGKHSPKRDRSTNSKSHLAGLSIQVSSKARENQ